MAVQFFKYLLSRFKISYVIKFIKNRGKKKRFVIHSETGFNLRSKLTDMTTSVSNIQD